MPRVVRNFWIELEVDGKKRRIAAGPRGSGGGFNLSVSMREKGSVRERVLEIVGRVLKSGELELTRCSDLEISSKTVLKTKR